MFKSRDSCPRINSDSSNMLHGLVWLYFVTETWHRIFDNTYGPSDVMFSASFFCGSLRNLACRLVHCLGFTQICWNGSRLSLPNRNVLSYHSVIQRYIDRERNSN